MKEEENHINAIKEAIYTGSKLWDSGEAILAGFAEIGLYMPCHPLSLSLSLSLEEYTEQQL